LKRCQRCEQELPYENFSKSKGAYDGHARVCKGCAYTVHYHWRQANMAASALTAKKWRAENTERSRDYFLKRHYGLPPGAYAKMLTAQNGCCALCGADNPRQKGIVRFHVDHDHDSGRINKLLCYHCNVGLGHFNHDPDLLLKAINYLAECQTER
jgi:hypothetical protein